MLENVPSGTIALGAGRAILSRAIALGTCDRWQLLRRQWISHAALVFELHGEKLIVESTTLNDTPCCVTGRRIRGVQAHPLETWVRDYDGRVWLCEPDWWARSLFDDQAAVIRRLAMSKLGTAYDEVGALVTGLDPLASSYHFSRHRFFCSELVAWILDHLRLPPVQTRLRPGLVTPAELFREAPERGWATPVGVS
jgi:hypothetical protein